jgi:ferredoxin-NADP reductase
MPTKWYNAEILKIENLTEYVRQFKVVLQDEDSFDFLPGQFMTMDLPVGEKRLHRWKSYSIANAPEGTNVLEFCIVRLEDGMGTKYLFDEAKVGTILKCKGPDGGFVLPEDLSKELVFICTGTGVAPFRSMIQYIVKNNLTFKGIHLVFGTRKEEDILYRKEFEDIAEKHPNFHYSIALSREEKPGFYHGYVHDIYMADKHIENKMYLLCGWSKMIDQAVAKLLIDKKVNKSNIKFELYG